MQVVLGPAGHLQRLQTPPRRRKNNRLGLEELGFGENKNKRKR